MTQPWHARVRLIVALLTMVHATVAFADSSVFILAQRSSMPLPGVDNIELQIGDITAGQTMTHLRWRQGGDLAGPRLLREQESIDFIVEGSPWTLTLVHLHNELIGEDWARFELIRPRIALHRTQYSATDVDSAREIHALIDAVEQVEGARFIRNGEEHDAKSAADHLRRKLKGAGGRVRTAEDFIEKIASKSSLSGNPYAMRLSNGQIVDAGDWFRAKLAAIRALPGT